jgi:hypothetical protein
MSKIIELSIQKMMAKPYYCLAAKYELFERRNGWRYNK